jgi:manganese transport protein
MKDREMLAGYVRILETKGYHAEGYLGFKHRSEEIARIVNEHHCNLLVIGSHGHKGVKDWLFGETINSVRHLIKIPVFIAR